jgi:ribosomal protein L34E
MPKPSLRSKKYHIVRTPGGRHAIHYLNVQFANLNCTEQITVIKAYLDLQEDLKESLVDIYVPIV